MSPIAAVSTSSYVRYRCWTRQSIAPSERASTGGKMVMPNFSAILS